MSTPCLQPTDIAQLGLRLFLDTWIEGRHLLALIEARHAAHLSDGLGEFPEFRMVEVNEDGAWTELVDDRIVQAMNDRLDARLEAIEEDLMGTMPDEYCA